MICPHCNNEIQTRAKLGEGTRKGYDVKVNENRHQILKVLHEAGKPLDVRQVLRRLIKNKIQRVSKRGTGWNYHTVQADLSILLGGKFIEMLKPHEVDYWDAEEGYQTQNVPKYMFKKKIERGLL